MRIVVTGATGYLGRRIVADLAARGHQVTALVRASSNTSELRRLAPTSTILAFDTHSPASLLAELAPEAVVHTACNYGRGGETFVDVIEGNYAFGCAVASAVSKGDTAFINVDTPLPPTINPYALTKRQFSDALRAFFSDRLRAINVVLHTMYGPGDSPTKFTTHVVREFLQGAPSIRMTPGEQLRDFIYIDDVVAAFRIVTEASRDLTGGTMFELGSGQAVPLRDYVVAAQHATGAATEIVMDLPYRNGDLTPMRGDTRALGKLGWRPRFSLAEGMRQLVAEDRVRWQPADPATDGETSHDH